jgi:hypothetical protein
MISSFETLVQHFGHIKTQKTVERQTRRLGKDATKDVMLKN